MEHEPLLNAILDDVSRTLRAVEASQVAETQAAILAAERVFVAGKGRSGLQMRAFAMRLMHLGLRVHAVDEVTAPAIGAGDLLLIGSGSGRTGSLLRYAEALPATGASLALFTGNPGSPLAALARTVLVIPASNYKAGPRVGGDAVLVMGSLFEHCLGLLCDLLVINLKATLAVDESAMRARHANLE